MILKEMNDQKLSHMKKEYQKMFKLNLSSASIESIAKLYIELLDEQKSRKVQV